MKEFWDWVTGDDRVTVMAVTRETYGTDSPDVLGDVHYYNFADWRGDQARCETEAENLCKMHNDAIEARDPDTLALCDLIASGGIAGAP